MGLGKQAAEERSWNASFTVGGVSLNVNVNVTSTATPATGEANDSPRERVKSTPGSSKATYEEVRAQVEERRHNGHGLSTGANAAKNRSSSPVPTSSSSPLPSSSALPMDIPGEASRRGRSASSVTSAGGRRGSNASSLDVPGDSLPSSTSDSGVQPHAAKSSPALPKTAAAPSLLLPEPIRSRTTSSPLYAAQPSSAPTMIIPSIHASRREK
ncbi:hypothetical protein BS47DRAFT_910629 [Hydnum rufescens UP504]|uniref:Uncharacterized protein n=1 Tax=Hydnum rufescens UP504 TaxID=1448309 RepID=A0A9P6DU46_9AGAM|nr:hypothetical protein BS47DRAFT_910629 [Hydnum rufescens UP504]